MPYREVTVFDVKEVPRLWFAGAGKKMCDQAGLVRREGIDAVVS